MTFVEAPKSSMEFFKGRPFMPNEMQKGGYLSLGRSRYIVFKMMGGYSFSVGTCKTGGGDGGATFSVNEREVSG
jgi:hypothetical protein